MSDHQRSRSRDADRRGAGAPDRTGFGRTTKDLPPRRPREQPRAAGPEVVQALATQLARNQGVTAEALADLGSWGTAPGAAAPTGGVSVGAAGDRYEQHADRVADAVVRRDSAEGLLDEMAPPSGQGGGRAVQRQAAPPGAAPGDPGRAGAPDVGARAPHTSHEVEIKVAGYGGATVVIKLTVEAGNTAAVSADGTSAISDRLTGELKLLEPKMVANMSSFYGRLETALLQAEFGLEVFEGLSLNLELSGPEASLSHDGAAVSAAKIAVKGVGDVTHWLGGLGDPTLAGKLALKLEIEGSYTIGGALLAKVAELSHITRRLDRNVAELELLTDDLQQLAKQEQALVAERKRLDRQRRAARLQTKGDPFSHRAGGSDPMVEASDRRIHELDQKLNDVRAELHGRTARAGVIQRELSHDARRLTGLEKKLDGKIAKRLVGRFGRDAAARLAKVVAKLIPVLNVISVVADAYEILQLYLAWEKAGFDLPTFQERGASSLDDRGDGDAGGESDDSAAEGAGAGGSLDGGIPTAPGDEPKSRDLLNKAGPGNADAVSNLRAMEENPDHDVTEAKEGLNPNARRLLVLAEGHDSIRLEADHVRIFGELVPADLTKDQMHELVVRIIDDGDKRRARPSDPHELLGMLDRAVRSLHEPQVTVSVNGGGRPDLGTPPPDGPVAHPSQVDDGPVTDPRQVAGPSPTRRRRGTGSGARPRVTRRGPRGDAIPRGPAPVDAVAAMIHEMPAEEIESRVTLVDGKLDYTALAAWLAGFKRVAIDADHRFQLESVTVSAERLGPGRDAAWHLELHFVLLDFMLGGRVKHEQQFMIAPGPGSSVDAERYRLLE